MAHDPLSIREAQLKEIEALKQLRADPITRIANRLAAEKYLNEKYKNYWKTNKK